jgi:hypothetical protein
MLMFSLLYSMTRGSPALLPACCQGTSANTITTRGHMGWVRITDRRKLRRAELAVGAELAGLWGYEPDQPSDKAVHTRTFRCRDGRTGWLYTDGHIDWD